MEVRNPLLPRERKEYGSSKKARWLRLSRGLTQREVTKATGIDGSAVRDYELQKDEKVDSRLRTRGNMVERAFIRLTDKLDELKNKPASEKYDELIRKLVTFVCMDGNNMRNARTVGCLGNNDVKLFPKT